MIKRSFFGFAKPNVQYERADIFPMRQEIPAPAQVTFLADVPYERADLLTIQTGDAVGSGQKIQPVNGNPAYVTAAAGGVISSISSHIGNFGKKYTAITIDVDKDAVVDTQLQEAGKELTMGTIADLLRCVPGGLPDGLFNGSDALDTIVVQGADEDLLGITQPYIVKQEMSSLKQGVALLQKVTGAKRVVLTVPFSMASEGGASGAEVKTLSPKYPAANPRLIARDCLGITIPAGSTCEAAGICFISAEAVAALGKAYETGTIPNRKIITVVKRSGEKMLVSAVIGTPAGDVLAACSETLNANDRFVFGGPMTGSAAVSESDPVGVDTDIIIVQDSAALPAVVDRSCINCGECVRMCPANVPVNILIRYLAAGEYSDAVDQCDLLSCIECGLCAFVCPVNIPIFQYIKLGKYEFASLNTAEADDA